MMPTTGICKLFYDIWCLNRALGNPTINSYQSYLLENSTKKYDTKK